MHQDSSKYGLYHSKIFFKVRGFFAFLLILTYPYIHFHFLNINLNQTLFLWTLTHLHCIYSACDIHLRGIEMLSQALKLAT